MLPKGAVEEVSAVVEDFSELKQRLNLSHVSDQIARTAMQLLYCIRTERRADGRLNVFQRVKATPEPEENVERGHPDFDPQRFSRP